MLSPETVRVVKATAPVLAEQGEIITTHFYQQMFHHNPELLDIFNSSNQHTGDQPRALAAAVYGYAANIDNLGALTAVVQRIAHKHASFNIRPEHYPIVGRHLLEAVAHVLGDAATDEIVSAWTEAYQFLADLFISVEEGIYQDSEAREGGWRGTREFRVARKERESDVITSFYLEPADGGSVVSFRPGQYIGIYLNPEGHPHREIRQYSLSDSPNGKYYRISVKREVQEGFEGLVSNYLHDRVSEGDVVELSPPAGDFFLDLENSKVSPVVLISGGVGVTPMMSMLNTLVGQSSTRPIRFVHSAISPSVHAFSEWVRALAEDHDMIDSVVFYDEPEAVTFDGDVLEGRANLDRIRERIELVDADYYFCGPVGFISMVNKTLKSWGIPEERIHYEVFGPHKDI